MDVVGFNILYYSHWGEGETKEGGHHTGRIEMVVPLSVGQVIGARSLQHLLGVWGPGAGVSSLLLGTGLGDRWGRERERERRLYD